VDKLKPRRSSRKGALKKSPLVIMYRSWKTIRAGETRFLYYTSCRSYKYTNVISPGAIDPKKCGKQKISNCIKWFW
jgi:hypothetical protein